MGSSYRRGRNVVNHNDNGDTCSCRSIIRNTMEMNTMEMLENMVAAGIYETIEEAIDECALRRERRLK